MRNTMAASLDHLTDKQKTNLAYKVGAEVICNNLSHGVEVLLNQLKPIIFPTLNNIMQNDFTVKSSLNFKNGLLELCQNMASSIYSNNEKVIQAHLAQANISFTVYEPSTLMHYIGKEILNQLFIEWLKSRCPMPSDNAVPMEDGPETKKQGDANTNLQIENGPMRMQTGPDTKVKSEKCKKTKNEKENKLHADQSQPCISTPKSKTKSKSRHQSTPEQHSEPEPLHFSYKMQHNAKKRNHMTVENTRLVRGANPAKRRKK